MRAIGFVVVLGVALATGAAGENVQPVQSALRSGDWLDKPSGADVDAVYPPRAVKEGVGGTAEMECAATAEGTLGRCRILQETPAGYGFGDATLNLAGKFRMAPKTPDGHSVQGGIVRIPLTFRPPEASKIEWLAQPPARSLADLLPAKALDAGIGGSATLDCGFTAEGYLADCKVVSEQPAGYGFGAAALQSTRPYRAKPVPGIETGRMQLPMQWSAPPRGTGYRMDAFSDGLLTDPVWTETPTAAAMRAAWPAKAGDLSVGQATLRCHFDSHGRTRRCSVQSEDPAGHGFGATAKTLGEFFVVRFAPEDARKLDNFQVDIPIRLRNPGMKETPLRELRWIRTLTPEGAERLYPAPARADGVTTGVGYVDCAADGRGEMTDCRIAREEPTGKGFGSAALEAAKLMQLNPWTGGGEPVEGRRFTLPIRFTLAESVAKEP
jgi:TonB family protein